MQCLETAAVILVTLAWSSGFIALVAAAPTNQTVAVKPIPFDCSVVLCAINYDPLLTVCAPDGHTYVNECVARCAAKVNLNGPFKKGPCPPRKTCVCTALYAPVCDASGKTWSSKCNADCAGAPRPFTSGVCPVSSGCICPALYNPVCGVDGKTYGNSCEAACAKVAVASNGPCPVIVPPIVCDPTDPGVRCFADPCGVVDASPCKGQAGYQCMSNYCGKPTTYLEETINSPCGAIYVNTATLTIAPECNPSPAPAPSPAPCLCTLEYAPVCGVDGLTYGNACAAKCAGVAIDFVGECPPKDPPCKLLCKCAVTDEPVCGSNGKTYPNPCSASCDCVSSTTPGPCPPPSSPGCNKIPCPCAYIDAPVCGSDGTTYGSPCLASCSGCVKSWTPGPCNPCANISTIYAPVCGADGKTYHNKQAAVCQNITVLSVGPCRICPLLAACPVTTAASPVCCTDGRTYCNPCVAKVLQATTNYKGICPIPKCLPQGSVCLLAKSSCCTGLSCNGGPVLREGQIFGTCISGIGPIG